DTEETRREVLAQLRYAGDPRLVPALVRVLESDVPGAVIDAARALANVRDPRVVPALRRRYARSVIDAERATLAGALGAHGVVAGQDYVRSLLDRDEADVLVAAMESLEELGGDADVERLRDRLDHPDEGVVFHAVEALGRIGDGRVMAPLGAVLEGGATASLRGAVEDARRAIEARLELRGEELPDTPPLPALERMTETAARASPFARFRARRLYAFGWLYLLLGLRRRGLAAFERAGELRPGWAGPPLAVGLAHARRGRHGQALAAFRRALAIDRRGVETSSTVMPFVARAFLRRAEELEDAGRAEVAAGLFAEALDLDLRRAPPALRFELERRRERPRLAGDLTPAPGASRRASRSGASS
ncbi:MAG: HEAT repeat domain-containing protein, partial [Myxococcota bacterium]